VLYYSYIKLLFGRAFYAERGKMKKIFTIFGVVPMAVIIALVLSVSTAVVVLACTPTPTHHPTHTPTHTHVPTDTPTLPPTDTPTLPPPPTETVPTIIPTDIPTIVPTNTPTLPPPPPTETPTPTTVPTDIPTIIPTHVPTLPPPPDVYITLWIMKNNSLAFDLNEDAGCFTYAYSPEPQSPSLSIPAFCDLAGAYMGDSAVTVLYSGKLYGANCWGDGCYGDIVLAKYNTAFGFHLRYDSTRMSRTR
jgi:hypothetical protein